MAVTKPFPTTAFRRARERSSGFYFAFGVDDLSSQPPTGQTLTFDRNSSRTVYDSTGRVSTLAYDQMPWSGHYNSTSGVWEPVYDAQTATTNLCLRSEDFGTTWSAVGTPTRTASALSIGDLTLDKIGDDAAGTLEGYTQAVTFTGNAVKAVSLFMAAGTSTSTVVRVRDTSASANRLLAVITWSGGVPTVAMTTGTNAGVVTCASSVYRFTFQTTSVTAANTNQIEVYPASDSGLGVSGTGTVYAGGVQAENNPTCRAYIKTLGSTAATALDSLTATVTLPLSDFTVYARLARPSWAGVTGGASPGIVGHKDVPATNGAFYIYYNPLATLSVVSVIRDFPTATSQSADFPSGGALNMAVQYRNLTTAAQTRIDTGSGYGSWSSTGPALTSWDSNTIGVGVLPTTSVACDAGVRRVLIAPGLRTLAELQGVAL